MKETGIIFCGSLVPKLLDGTKTVTRRLVRFPQGSEFVQDAAGKLALTRFVDHTHVRLPCPYGRPGDLLYVKETWRPSIGEHGTCYAYRATETHACGKPVPDEVQPYEKWRSPRFMPKAAARVWLELGSVRAERLQDITEADTLEEGMNGRFCDSTSGALCDGYGNTTRDQFARLWDELNYAKAPFDSNPFVWRLEFRRVDRKAVAA